MTSNKKFQFENEAGLSLKEIKQMYDNFVNPGLSKLYQFFSFVGINLSNFSCSSFSFEQKSLQTKLNLLINSSALE